MIPKIAHFVWFGTNFSFLRYVSVYSFKKMNPTWKVILHASDKFNLNIWNERIVQDFSSTSISNHLNELKENGIEIKEVEPIFSFQESNPVRNSDIYRWYVLSKYGGLYIDTDILFFKSVDVLEDILNNSDVLLCINSRKWNYIGFVGSSAKNSFYKKVFELSKYSSSSSYQSSGAYSVNTIVKEIVYSLIRKKRIRCNNLIFHNLSEELVYPISYLKMKEVYEKGLDSYNFPNSCIGFHWFGGLPCSYEFNEKATKDNFRSFNNLVSKCMEMIVCPT